MTSLGQLEDIFEVRDGSAWIGYLDPHDPTPPHAQSVVPQFDSIVAVNLATGARTTWFYRPGQSVRLAAIDQSGCARTSSFLDRPEFKSARHCEQRAPVFPHARVSLFALAGRLPRYGTFWTGMAISPRNSRPPIT